MVNNLLYQDMIFEPFSILSGLNMNNTIQKKYEKFAIPKIEDATLKLNGFIIFIHELPVTEAAKYFADMQDTMNLFSILKNKVKGSIEFNQASQDFFNVLEKCYKTLEDRADYDYAYQISQSILNDWNSPENNHWNNY